LSFADACRKARMVMGDVAHGNNPAQERIERRQVLTFTDLGREYIEMAQRRHKRWTEEKRIIEKHLVPVLGHRLLTDIRRRDIRDLVEDIAHKRSAPTMANRTLGMLSQMFNYALDRDDASRRKQASQRVWPVRPWQVRRWSIQEGHVLAQVMSCAAVHGTTSRRTFASRCATAMFIGKAKVTVITTITRLASGAVVIRASRS
jgi:hypothetical protein